MRSNKWTHRSSSPVPTTQRNEERMGGGGDTTSFDSYLKLLCPSLPLYTSFGKLIDPIFPFFMCLLLASILNISFISSVVVVTHYEHDHPTTRQFVIIIIIIIIKQQLLLVVVIIMLALETKLKNESWRMSKEGTTKRSVNESSSFLLIGQKNSKFFLLFLIFLSFFSLKF